MQLSFLRIRGLHPDMRLLDVGCGGLRGGVPLIGYLAVGNYFGIDKDAALLDAGYEHELPSHGLQGRLPRTNLLHDDSFAARRFGVNFDMAIAQSLFSLLPPASINRCLAEVAQVVEPDGIYFATFFECPADRPAAWIQRPGDVTTYADRDPYHYRWADLAACATGLPWRCERIGPWGHPRGQVMTAFVRTPD